MFSTDQRGKGVDYRSRHGEAARHGVCRPHLARAPHGRDAQRSPKRLGGDTGLYDTTKANEKMVREYDDDYVNSVVIMTDGKNDDPW